MRVLVDVVHPADVLFFAHPIRMLQARGDEIQVLSRHKDVACDLLDALGIPHRPVSRAGTGYAGLATELLRRDIAIMRAARQFRADAMIGFGGVAIAHAGALTGIPSIAYYDADTARLQTRIAWPFVSHLYVPDAYTGRVPSHRTHRFAGIKELSYLHPENFVPSRDIAIDAGLDPHRDNFLLRIVSWRAGHDIGKTGWTTDMLNSIVSQLRQQGRVHISSERDLPADAEPLRFRGPPLALHHLLAFCRLAVGESVTIAQEAFVLGVPAIYAGHDHPGTIRELASLGAVSAMKDPSVASLTAEIAKRLEEPRDRVRVLRDDYVRTRPNLARHVVDSIDRHASRGSAHRA